MADPRSLLPFLLLLGLALSGCAGKGSPEGGDASPTAPSFQNAIQGRVTSIDYIPLAGVRLDILSVNASTTTNATGEYRFTDFQPREYLVAASKDGFKPKTQRALVAADQVFQLDFVLEDAPVVTPHKEVLDRQGTIACDLVYGADPEGRSHSNCAPIVPDNRIHEFNIKGGPSQIIIEAFWEPTTLAANQLTLSVESVGFGEQDLIFGTHVGPSGTKITLGQTLAERYYGKDGVLRTRMSGGASITGDESGPDAGLALQQTFTIYVSVFYAQFAPPNYSAGPSGPS
jgi:hypothetical protein